MLMSWFFFCGLLGAWSVTSAPGLLRKAGYSSSSLFLFLLALGIARLVLWRRDPGSAPPDSGNFPGTPPDSPPLEGAPVPVPIRPAPRLTRSAAEPLPISKD
jgi:hypothetical protein